MTARAKQLLEELEERRERVETQLNQLELELAGIRVELEQLVRFINWAEAAPDQE